MTLRKEIFSSKDLSTPLDFIQLKCELLVEGVRLDKSAYGGIGTFYKEQVKFIYEWDVTCEEMICPQDFVLPTAFDELPEFDELGTVKNGLVVMFRGNRRSPFVIRKTDNRLLLEKYGGYLCDVKFTPRPRFYEKKTADDVPLKNIFVHGGMMGLLCSVSAYCHYFQDGNQCRFCNLFPTKKLYRDEIVGLKTAKQLAEATSIAWEEGICQGLTLTGGILPGRRELDHYIEIVKEVKNCREWTDKDNLPICIVPGAPAPGDYWQIDKLRETGAKYLSINLEVGNPDMFKVICPGKAKNGGYENWLGALEYGVKNFGKWNVRSNFVPGIEPMSDTLKAYQYLAGKGIWTHFFQPWFPDSGSLLEGHRSPSGEWYFELANQLVDIWEGVNAPIEQLNIFPGANDSIAFDVYRTRQGRKISEFYELLGKEIT